MQKSRIGFAAIVAALVLPAGSAPAQDVFGDHLECFKIKDEVKLKGVVDMETFQFGVADNCKISKTKFFCAPAQKSVESVVDKKAKGDGVITPATVRPPNAVLGDQICYKLKCKGSLDETFSVSDQFGTRTVKVSKDRLACVPAVKGEAPPLEDLTPCNESVFDVWEFPVGANERVVVWANTVDASTAADLRLSSLSCDVDVNDDFRGRGHDDDFRCTFPPEFYACPLWEFEPADSGTCTIQAKIAGEDCVDPEIADYQIGVLRNGVNFVPTLTADDVAPVGRAPGTSEGGDSKK